MAGNYKSLAERVAGFGCPADIREGLRPAEVDAYEIYRMEFADILFKLYRTVDPKTADDFVRPLMQRLARPRTD